MSLYLQLLLVLAIFIGTAKAGGYLSLRLGQPSVLGELIVGILLGPSLIDILHLPLFGSELLVEMIHLMAEIGVMLLMFLAGLELHFSDLVKSGKVSTLAGSFGVFFPLLLGTALVLVFPITSQEAIFLGLILAATSVSISAQTLMELKMLRSRVGISLLGAAVFDDVLVVLGLSIFSAIVFSNGAGGISKILWIILQMALYLVIAGLAGLYLVPRLSRMISRQPISQGLIAFTVVVLLLYGWAAEVFGNMAAITGAFLAGLLFARSPVRERVEQGIVPIAYGLFVPVFFIDVGLKANLRELLGPSFSIFLVLSLVAITGKILGCGLGALLAGLSRKESLQLGIGMTSRGEVGLIVASVGITNGIINQQIYSAIVGVVILTTLLTPPLLRLSYRGSSAPEQAGPSVGKDTAPKQTVSQGEEP